MNQEEKVEVSIYCKIFADTYPVLEGEVTGDQIVNHLLTDCGGVWEEDDSAEGAHLIPGDPCIWYLGTNEKRGDISLTIGKNRWDWKWGYGGANFKRITKFVNILRTHQVINRSQYLQLKEAIRVGETIGDMYEIGNYLKSKREGKEVKAA